ncbi:MAG: NHL repeat-containing protein [candidate division WOR-3 bacterium]
MHLVYKCTVVFLFFFIAANLLEAKLERVGYSYGGYYFEKFTRATLRSFEIDASVFGEPYDAVGYTKADSHYLFIVDAMWHRVIYLKGVPEDSINTWTKSIGKLGFGMYEFNTPHGIGIDNNHIIYIADTDNRRIVKLVMNGDTLKWLNTFGEAFLMFPYDLSVSGNNIYVVDAGNNKVFRFGLDGILQCVYSGSGVGVLSSPKGIAVYGDCIYITDTGNRRIVLLKDYGTSMGFVRARTIDVGQDRLYLDRETDMAGCVYLVDALQNKIIKISKGLEHYLYSFGSYGTNINQFIHPKGLFLADTLIGIIENWGEQSGFQVYKSVVNLICAKVQPNVVDVTLRNCSITFAVDEYSMMKVIVANKILWAGNVSPGIEYTTVWDGKDSGGNLCLPGTYRIEFQDSIGRLIGSINVIVKGTIKSGVLSPNEHWTEEGESYGLTGNVQVAGGGKLTIDPGVKVMPVGNYGIKLPQTVSGNSIFAQGTALNPILFTPHRKLYPQPDPVPKGFWKGIYFWGL